MADEREHLTYAEAGVDIEFLNRLKAYGREISRRTKNEHVQEVDGKFFLDTEYVKLVPVETDGIGTKEDLLLKSGKPFVAGWDLVAANVNDVLRHGAEPAGMTVDIALQNITEEEFKQLMDGVRTGLEESWCALIGGETAIHPNLKPGHEKAWHLSATAFGAIKYGGEPITGKDIRQGDVVLGFASSGLHTNGFSLARSVLLGEKFNDKLTTPSRIYAKPMLDLLLLKTPNNDAIKGASHITGGGLTGRLEELVPNGLCVVVDSGMLSSLVNQSVFMDIQEAGNIATEEMYRTFNMGIGFVIVVGQEWLEAVNRRLAYVGEKAYKLGRIEANSGSKFTLI